MKILEEVLRWIAAAGILALLVAVILAIVDFTLTYIITHDKDL